MGSKFVKIRIQEGDYLRSVELTEGRDQVFEHLRCMYFMNDLKAYFLYFSADFERVHWKKQCTEDLKCY